MLEWDIEPYPKSNPDKDPQFRAVHVKPGTGRWNTRGQAEIMAAEASGHLHNPTEIGFRMEYLSIMRERKKKNKR